MNICKKTATTILFLLFIASIANGQGNKSPIVKFLIKRGYTFPDSTRVNARPDSFTKWPDTLYYYTVYKSKLMGSPCIPITFSRVEYEDGQYQVTPTVGAGYGYTWFFGDFIMNEDEKITVDPTFYFGIMGDIGLQSNFSLQKLGSVFTGGLVGFGPFSLFFGYDYITHYHIQRANPVLHQISHLLIFSKEIKR